MRSWRLALLFALSMPSLAIMAAAKDDWQSDLHKWAVQSDANPNCTVRYTVGIYRPDMGDKPAWGMMTEKMFKWFSSAGVKLAPSVCPVSRATRDKAEYRILFSVSPMKTVSQTTHGSEVHTTGEPFNANVTSRTTYSDGSTANGTATINGQQTSTVVVPTETTISQSSVALYMYTYRVNGDQLELMGSDSVVFSRVTASGSGENAAGTELGAGIGNLIRASGDRHRADKLYEEAVRAILADSKDRGTKQDTVSLQVASAAQSSQQVSPPPAPMSPAPASASVPALPSAQSIDTPKEQSATDDAETQFHLGTLYETGKGVPQDYAQAVLWYRKAAEQTLAIAQYRLGVLYANGVGVPLDKAQSAAWFQKAADQGYVYAQEMLGSDYLTGEGVQRDYAEAYFWFDIACTSKAREVVAGERATMRDTAAAYLSPADLSSEQERARKWFEDHPAKPQ